jgi:hypothetical protein
LGTRYIDYGLTGGLFILVAIFLYESLPQEIALPSLGALRESLDKALPGSPDFVNTLLTTLLVICVFAIGLLLDLIGSVLVAWEAAVFRRHLLRNREWILPVFDEYRLFLGDDVQEFLAVRKPSIQKAFSLRSQPLAVVPQFNRLQSVLLAHLLLLTDPSKVEVVLDQLHTCRVARAVSSGLYILAILFWFFSWGYGVYSGVKYWFLDNLPILVFFVCSMVLSGFVINRAYSRYCASLFSFVFVLSKQTSRSPVTA